MRGTAIDKRRKFYLFKRFQNFPPPLIDRTPLFVQNIVVFQKMFPQIEIRAFHFFLRLRDRL